MANLNHTLAIPGYIMILLVFWGWWFPLFVIFWIIRKTTRGPMSAEEAAREFPRPAPGWLGPDVKSADDPDSAKYLDEEETDDKHKHKHKHKHKQGPYKKQDKYTDADELEMRRRDLEKKKRRQARREQKLKDLERGQGQKQGNEDMDMEKVMARREAKGKGKSTGEEGWELQRLSGEIRRPEQARTHESRRQDHM